MANILRNKPTRQQRIYV